MKRYIHRERLRDVSVLLILAAIAFAAICLCSYFFIPSLRTVAADQDIFYVIGRNWANGELPYVTAWDSKGPIIFLANMLGYLITKSEMGVVLIDALNFVLVLWGCYYFLRKYCNAGYSLVCILAFVANFVTISSGGNMVGNYTLLLSAACTFLTYKWSRGFQDGKTEHPYRYSVIYGLFFAASLLSRLTNAMVLCCSMLWIFGVLVYHKQWRNIGANAIAFVVGFLIMFAPFCLYFVYHGAFEEMWYAAVTYNIDYTTLSHPTEIVNNQHPVIYFTLYNLCIVTTIGIAIIALARRTRMKVAIFWGAICIACAIWIFNSQAYANYTISYLPIIFVGLIELAEQYKVSGKSIYKWCYFSILLVAVISIANRARVMCHYQEQATLWLKSSQAQMALLRTIPSQDSFMIYNGDSYVYTKLNIHPYYPYWIVQDWAIEHSKTHREIVRRCYAQGNAKWIIIYEYEKSHIKDILLSRYEISKEDKANGLTLWRLK